MQEERYQKDKAIFQPVNSDAAGSFVNQAHEDKVKVIGGTLTVKVPP